MSWARSSGRLMTPLTRISPDLLIEIPQVSDRWRGQCSGCSSFLSPGLRWAP